MFPKEENKMKILSLRKGNETEIFREDFGIIMEDIYEWNTKDILTYLIRDRKVSKKDLHEITGLSFPEIHAIRHYCDYIYKEDIDMIINRDHIIAFCIALRADHQLTEVIIKRFGYILNDSDRDRTIEYILYSVKHDESSNLITTNDILISMGFEPLTNVYPTKESEEIEVLEWT